MSCNSCAKSFSLLRKEKGCPGCGFSYCSKCLDSKVFLPKLNAEAKVCLKCKKLASAPNEPTIIAEAPDAYYRRVEATNDMQLIHKKTDNNILTKDQEIVERLQKLKEGRTAIPMIATDEDIRNRLQNIKSETPSTSDTQIQERLAKLRGVPVISSTNKPVLLPADTRTEQEQANDLLKQYMEQTHIDTKYKDEFEGLINDMEMRMHGLRDTESASFKEQKTKQAQDNRESEDEEEAVRKMVEKIKAEAAITDDDPTPSNADELPFCEICNEDATMRCLGCKYLFCKRCFVDHKDDDDGCNRYEPYQAPK